MTIPSGGAFSYFGRLIINVLIVFKFSRCIWSTVLAFRERRATLDTEEVPAPLSSYISQDHFNNTKIYHLKNLECNTIYSIYRTLLTSIWLFNQGLHRIWVWAGKISESEYSRTCLFITILTWSRALFALPYKYYRRFYVENRYGLKIPEKSKLDFFCRELIRASLATLAHTGLATLMSGLIHVSGSLFYLYVTLISSLVEVLFLTIYADYMSPNDDELSLLPDGSLKRRVEQMATRVQFPLSKIVVIQEDGCLGSPGNAFFMGFFRGNRIVLFKSMLRGHVEKTFFKPWKTFSVDELTGIIAHEMGHWKLNHLFQSLVFHQVVLFFQLLLSSKMLEGDEIFKIFGFEGERPVVIGLILTVHVLMEPFTSVVRYMARVISRSNEAEADEFAKCQGFGPPLATALSKIYARIRSFPNPDPLYVDYFYTHPPILERIRRLTGK